MEGLLSTGPTPSSFTAFAQIILFNTFIRIKLVTIEQSVRVLASKKKKKKKPFNGGSVSKI